jgi:hypothetical protein
MEEKKCISYMECHPTWQRDVAKGLINRQAGVDASGSKNLITTICELSEDIASG